jgi:hypothetical protein
VKEVGEAETLHAGSVRDSDGVALDDDAVLGVRMETAR